MNTMDAPAAGSAIFITDEAVFNEYCAKWQNQACIALDTEFVRTNTFYSRIGLLQIADRDACYLIDPLEIQDWSAFIDLLQNPDCSFVIHSCSEDLNLLQNFLGCVPVNLFDTQIASAFIGLGFSLSYQALVLQILDIAVAKDETRSDWLRRPLSPTQIEYAAIDVLHLLELRDVLADRMASKGVSDWFELEARSRLSTAAVAEDKLGWETLYAGLSNAWRLGDQSLEYLQKLCYWRELEARRRNKPRNWIAKDVDLFTIAKGVEGCELFTESALTSLVQTNEKLDRKFVSRYSGTLVKLFNGNKFTSQPIDRDLLKLPLSPRQRSKLKACQKVVEVEAGKLSIATELLARKKHLSELVQNFEKAELSDWPEELKGWRKQLLEPKLAAILENDGNAN